MKIATSFEIVIHRNAVGKLIETQVGTFLQRHGTYSIAAVAMCLRDSLCVIF